MLLLLLIVIIFSIPAVQTIVAKKVTKSLNETYGTNIQIDRLGLNWKGEVDIRGVYIEDHHGDTLIYSEEIQTNILSIKKLANGNPDFGFIDLTNAKLFVKTYKNEDDDNLFIFTEKFDDGTSPSGNIFTLLSENVTLLNTQVKITDENIKNPESINFTHLNLEGEKFKVIGPDVFAQIKSLTFDAAQGYSIQNMQADFSYTLDAISFNDLLLETTDSYIKGTVILNYGEKGLSDFNNNVVFDAQIEDSKISTNDLNTLYNEFGRNIGINLEGDINGTLNDLTFSRGRLTYANTKLLGTYRFQNLFKSEETFIITGTNHTISSNYYDLKRLMPNLLGTSLPKELKPFGNFTTKGKTTLEGDLLTTDSSIFSALGSAETRLEIGNIQDFDNAFYRGEVQLMNFDLGKIAGTTSLGAVEADLTFDGRGFTPKTVNTQINGTISSFIFEGYNYQNITVSGSLKDPIFNGKLKIDDPNLKMDFNGLIDISKHFNQYDFDATIEYAELNKLNLFKRDSVAVFAGRIIMNMQGTTVDDAVGTIEFLETFYQTEVDDFYFDDFLISSYNTKDIRTIEIKSPDIIDGKISGKFLVEDIPNLFHNSIGSIYANYIPNEVTTDQYIDYEFEIYNKIVDVFVPQLRLGENTRIKGSVYSDESKFKMNFRSPELLLFDNYLGKVNIQLDNDNPLFNAFISIDSLHNGFYNLSDINIINKTLNDTLYIQSEFKGGDEHNDIFNMQFYHTINPMGKSVVGIKRSKITYQNNDWFLNRDNNNRNKLTFDNNFRNITLDSLTLRHQNELIRMAGVMRDSTFTDIRLDFTNVDIGKLVPQVDSLNLSGDINGRLNILMKKGAYYPNSRIVVNKLNMNNIALGDLNINIKGNSDLTKYNITSSLVNNNIENFTAVGSLEVLGKGANIDLDVNFDKFNLSAFSPFGGDVISNIRGFATGRTKVKGNYKSPDLTGNIFLNESGMKIPYLNVDLDLEENTSIAIRKGIFAFSPTKVTDTKYDTDAMLRGNITHENFGDWAMNLTLETNRFLVLDTPPDEDALYYGTAFISGVSKFVGPLDNLVIDVVATTEKGTKFKIPISDATSISDDSFIHFISPEEKKARTNGIIIVPQEVKGLSLNFELDINENAEIEVLVDKKNNSTLKGRGFGNLLLEINTNGKFKMWGDFLVTEGTYDFRYGGLVDKTIDVVDGGNITWDGNPTRARLDLTAKYSTEANPAGLLDSPAFNRKIAVDVLIHLTGEILQPELDFGIQFPGVSSTVRSELEYILQDKDKRQTQALYLVSTGGFQSDAAAGAITSTLAERVNKLVADIFSDSDARFKVLPYYNPASRTVDQQTSEQYGFQFSSQFSERLLIDGKVAVPVGGSNESSVAGDIRVQWLVNEDGSLRINFFNRQAGLQFFGEDQIYEQGGGISYSVDFDTFSELMEKLFKKKVTLIPKNELPIMNDNDSSPVNFKAPSGEKKENE
ncbi:MAG: translocation/assembly module TamB [Flavobacteriaceae bacterium]|nr:translocation/assembly module TamB [Flavobacteriaceae bacterium]